MTPPEWNETRAVTLQLTLPEVAVLSGWLAGLARDLRREGWPEDAEFAKRVADELRLACHERA